MAAMYDPLYDIRNEIDEDDNSLQNEKIILKY